MNKQVAKKLWKRAEEIAKMYSIEEREFNYTGERFEVNNIVPLSENTAVVVFNKSSGKKGIAFLFYIASREGHWQYFFPTDSHLLGMKKVEKYKDKIEEENYLENFKE